MSFDIFAMWTGRIVILSLIWSAIALFWWGSVTYLFRNSPAFRFAIFLWVTQKRKEKHITTLKTYDGKRKFEIREIKDVAEDKPK